MIYHFNALCGFAIDLKSALVYLFILQNYKSFHLFSEKQATISVCTRLQCSVLFWPFCSGFMNFRFSCSRLDIVRLLLCASLAVTVSACQKDTPEIVHEKEHTVSQTAAVPDLTVLCQQLKDDMKSINDQRTTLALEQINQQIRLCLPLVDYAEQKTLMALSNQMYNQFLHVQRTPLQQRAFEQYAVDQSQYPTIQQSQFEQLHLRDQYLMRHKDQAYIELVDQGPGNIFYRRGPQYLAKVFAPYLPNADKVFIEQLAAQNSQPLIQNKKLNINPNELVQRAMFWESYLQDYPDSNYRKDAEYLQQTYQALFFIGLDNSPVSEQYSDQNDVSAATWLEIEALAQQKQGALAQQAKQFMTYINMSPEQRLEKIKLPAAQLDKLNNNPHQLAVAQLNQYLNLKNIHLTARNKDCFSDAVCIPVP